LYGEISEDNISECIKWIVYENLDTSKQKILTLYINSTGGNLYDAFALIDVMRSSTHQIRTIGIGAVMSAAFLIFAAGHQGERYAARNTSYIVSSIYRKYARQISRPQGHYARERSLQSKNDQHITGFNRLDSK